ncbi:MAG: MSMEG_1061 family FMN-dependent PPOX-type flavoprotein [Halioglobus sp.]
MDRQHLIDDIAGLRAIIDEPNPAIVQKLSTSLDDICIEFIGRSPLLCLATTNADNQLDVSPKGDAPGFVKVLDNNTLAIGERPGNHLAFGFENILSNNAVGLIFIVPGVRETVRVNGRAHISKDPELLALTAAGGKPAILCTLVTVEECFFHCGKAMIRSKLWQPDSWPESKESGIAKQAAKAMSLKESDVDAMLEESYEKRLY